MPSQTAHHSFKIARTLPAFRLLSVVLSLALLGLLAGCKVGPDFQSPQMISLPEAWTGVAPTSQSLAFVATGQEVSLALWWRQLNDPMLTALIEEGVRNNLTVQIAESRLRQARASAGIAEAGLWPSAEATGSYQRLRNKSASAALASSGASGGSGGSTGGASSSVKRDQNLYKAGLDAVWELDLFGGKRRAVEAANANVKATQEALWDARISLAAEIALNYIQLRGFQEQIRIARNNLTAQKQTAAITRQRLAVGFVSALDVANADSITAATESQIPMLESAARQSIYALGILRGLPPASLLNDLNTTAPLPAVPAQIPAGLPSDLLRRRPDIRQAEAQIRAATAQIGVATADLFPKVTLTGSLSWQANLSQHWLNSANQTSSFGPSVSWNLFQGGAIISNIKLQKLLRDQAVLNYRQTVLTAFQEVENALIAFAKEQEHRASLQKAVAANRDAVRLSMQLYTLGQTDFISVLEAQRSLYSSEDALVQSERNISLDLIALYKALRGGWEE